MRVVSFIRTLAYNIGRAYAESGRFGEAICCYRIYLESARRIGPRSKKSSSGSRHVARDRSSFISMSGRASPIAHSSESARPRDRYGSSTVTFVGHDALLTYFNDINTSTTQSMLSSALGSSTATPTESGLPPFAT
jgi:hypothetical protein